MAPWISLHVGRLVYLSMLVTKVPCSCVVGQRQASRKCGMEQRRYVAYCNAQCPGNFNDSPLKGKCTNTTHIIL